MTREIPVTDIMDTPGDTDEYGTPDAHIAQCDSCGGLYRRGGWHGCVE